MHDTYFILSSKEYPPYFNSQAIYMHSEYTEATQGSNTITFTHHTPALIELYHYIIIQY